MSKTLDQLLARRVVDTLVPEFDLKRGSLLLIGAHLPDIALHVMQNGLYVTVVEANVERMNQFLGPLKEAGVDRSVTWDRRPYRSIEFVGSSFNYIVCWEGIPEAMEPALFFKKARRELKAGGAVYLRTPVIPDLVPEGSRRAGLLARMPAKVSDIVLRIVSGLQTRLALPDALDAGSIRETADHFLNLESVVPLSLFAERLEGLSGAVSSALGSLPGEPLKTLFALEGRVTSDGAASRLASSVLFKFAKTKEFGNIFKVTWQTD